MKSGSNGNAILMLAGGGPPSAYNTHQQMMMMNDNYPQVTSQNSTQRTRSNQLGHPPLPQRVNQARARSVNAQGAVKFSQGRAKANRSIVTNAAQFTSHDRNRSFTAQGGQIGAQTPISSFGGHAVDLNGNGNGGVSGYFRGDGSGPPHQQYNNINPVYNILGDPSHQIQTFSPSNNSREFETQRQYMQAMLSQNLGGTGRILRQGNGQQYQTNLPMTLQLDTSNNQRFSFNTTTPTPMNQIPTLQRKVAKHNKTNSTNTAGGGTWAGGNHQFQNRNVVETEQFLNQPLNQQMLNQTIQYMNGGPSAGGLQQLYTPLSNFQTISGPPVNQSPFYSQYESNNTRGLNYIRGSPKQPMTSLGVPMPQNMHLYNPFTNFKQGATASGGVGASISSSSSRISTQKIQLNNTVSHHIRSGSTYSKDLQSSHRQHHISSRRGISGGNKTMLIQQQSTLQNNSNAFNSVSEVQLIESEEYFEQGKVFLTDKKYREAIKAFQKSLTLNKRNYDALFYKGVSALDNGQPEKAIVDLNELIESCPDYRKTAFIVLSIAYRRTNDYTGALRTLSKAIVKYPRYIEAFIARGQIYIFQKKWDKALSDFRIVISVSGPPENNGLGYLGQGDCLKGIGNYNGALQSYSMAVEIDPACLQQGLMKRGILYLQMKYNEKALEDFNRLCDIAEKESDQQQADLDDQQALITLKPKDNEALPSQQQSSISVSKSYFYKAKALKKLDNWNDAILYFEQVIRTSCDDQFLQSSALYEIAKIKIQQKDFYEAFYNLQRATHYKLKQKKLINYKNFTEGVIFLMKRKTKTGIKLLTSLVEKIQQSSQVAQADYITPLVYLYRAYGYFVQDEYDKALKDYIKSNQLKKLNQATLFNMVMCQGLKALEKKEYENAISFFSKAGQKMPGNRDPYFMRAVSIVQYAIYKPLKPATKSKMLRDAKRDLNRALKHSPKDYQVMFFRGILNFALHYFYDAITDFETVIEKSEETNAKFYLARGRCYACLSMFKEAITDLSIAINLNKDLLDAYLNRGKCAYLIGDTGLAFMDFQRLIVLEPKNPMVHIYAGNLLMTTGSYEDATKAFTNADNIHKSPLALYQRSRCHVALNSMSEALKDLNKVIEQSPNDKVAIADRDCLTALKLATVGFNGQSVAQATSQQSVTGNQQQSVQGGSQTTMTGPYEKQVYEKAIVILTKLISYEKNEHLSKINHDSSVLYQHSQVIPSAQRTKVDKIKAIKRRRDQDKQMKHQGVGDNPLRKNDLRFRVQQQEGEGQGEEDYEEEYEELETLDQRELDKLNRQLEQASHEILLKNDESVSESQDQGRKNEMDEEEMNYYKENIFNKEDYYLYRAVMHFYAADYDKAITDFEQSSSIMHAQKVLYPRNQFPDSLDEDSPNRENQDAASQDSSQTDLSDVGLCSLNIHEYSFNTVLCLLLMKDYKKALTKLDYMFDTIPKKYAGQLWLVRGLVNQQVQGNQQQSKKDFKRAHKHDPENASKFLEQRQNVHLTVFPQQQRLCNGLACFKFSFPGYTQALYMKPSFSFPFIKPPNMIPCVENSVLEQFTTKAVPLKPEAPWIKRCSFGIKFTDEIYFTDDDREATPDEEKEYKKRKQQQQQRAARAAASFLRSHSERVVLRTNIFTEQPRLQPNQVPHPDAQRRLGIDDEVYADFDEDEDAQDILDEVAATLGVMNKQQQVQIDYEKRKTPLRPDQRPDSLLTKLSQQARPIKRQAQNYVADDDYLEEEAFEEEIDEVLHHDDIDEDDDEAAFKQALEKAKAGANLLADRTGAARRK